ncbi:hypothetical protein ACJX0J_037835, partial [Zea mays]
MFIAQTPNSLLLFFSHSLINIVTSLINGVLRSKDKETIANACACSMFIMILHIFYQSHTKNPLFSTF